MISTFWMCILYGMYKMYSHHFQLSIEYSLNKKKSKMKMKMSKEEIEFVDKY